MGRAARPDDTRESQHTNFTHPRNGSSACKTHARIQPNTPLQEIQHLLISNMPRSLYLSAQRANDTDRTPNTRVPEPAVTNQCMHDQNIIMMNCLMKYDNISRTYESLSTCSLAARSIGGLLVPTSGHQGHCSVAATAGTEAVMVSQLQASDRPHSAARSAMRASHLSWSAANLVTPSASLSVAIWLAASIDRNISSSIFAMNCTASASR